MIDVLLNAYPTDCHAVHVRAMGNAGGFSGARLWKIHAGRGPLCLRKWPSKHPSPDRLQWMHQVLRHVHRAGCAFVPAPICTVHGTTFLAADGHLWELTPWLPGAADYHRHPSERKLEVALQSLAAFHLAAAQFESRNGPSRGLRERREFTEQLLSGVLAAWRHELKVAEPHDLSGHFEEITRRAGVLLPELLRDLHARDRQTVLLQPCLRDVWHDHILFVGEKVSGLIDFGAMRMECAAGDIARLLGSFAGDNKEEWKRGLKAYQQVRPLPEAELQLLAVFDRANVVLAGLNWVRWIVVERRRFENTAAVHERVDEILRRLRIATSA